MTFFTILALFACIFSLISVLLSLYACILTKAMEKTTHTVQFMPVEEALSDKADLDDINTEQKEDNEDFYRMV